MSTTLKQTVQNYTGENRLTSAAHAHYSYTGKYDMMPLLSLFCGVVCHRQNESTRKKTAPC